MGTSKWRERHETDREGPHMPKQGHLITFDQGSDMMWTLDEGNPNCESQNYKVKRNIFEA